MVDPDAQSELADRLWRSLRRAVESYTKAMDDAQRAGRIDRAQRFAVAAAGLTRAIDRISALPDDRALSDGEVSTLQASLVQVFVAAAFLLHDLPFPSMSVRVTETGGLETQEGPRSADARTAAGEPIERFRVRTELAHDERGWWVEVLLWWNDRATGEGDPPRPEDDAFRIGPWPSRQVARREMRGDVRRLVTDCVQDLIRLHQGRFERFEVGLQELQEQLRGGKGRAS